MRTRRRSLRFDRGRWNRQRRHRGHGLSAFWCCWALGPDGPGRSHRREWWLTILDIKEQRLNFKNAGLDPKLALRLEMLHRGYFPRVKFHSDKGLEHDCNIIGA